jgi:hypothetical protein
MEEYYKNSKTSDGRFSACIRCAKANSSYAYHRKKRLGPKYKASKLGGAYHENCSLTL